MQVAIVPNNRETVARRKLRQAFPPGLLEVVARFKLETYHYLIVFVWKTQINLEETLSLK